MTNDLLHGLIRDGRLRAAINVGNKALVQRDGDRLGGVSPALAARLAQTLGAELETVIYDSANGVVTDADSGRWDVAFLAVDPARADRVTFADAYVTIETTYAVRAGDPITSVDQVDAPGKVILVATGSAYDLHLTKALRHATLLRGGTPPETMAAFHASEADAVAGVRQSLVAALGDDAAVRILPGAFAEVSQTMALRARHAGLVGALNAFVAQAKADGFVRAALDASGQSALTIPA